MSFFQIKQKKNLSREFNPPENGQFIQHQFFLFYPEKQKQKKNSENNNNGKHYYDYRRSCKEIQLLLNVCQEKKMDGSVDRWM
mgnify:CR=1 FL=1